MSIALSEFWTRLVQTGIVEAEACPPITHSYAAANGGQAPDNANSLAEFLVAKNMITKFQAESLLGDAPLSIRHGNFVQTSDQPSLPLGHWLPVRTIGPSPSGPRLGFLLRVPAAGLTEYLSQWLAAHAGVASPSLQPFELYGSPGSDMEIFTKLAPGRSLSDLNQSKMKVDRKQAISVAIEVANALAEMHTHGLVHGEVRADRVWIESDTGKPILLRDPSCAARTPRTDASLSWLHPLESPGSYAAPEFADPNHVCTPATDIYSLGCLLFRMIVGRMPVADQSIEQQISEHVQATPPELAEAVQQGESGDPALRVAAFAMAKNPGARFGAVQQVADALNAVLASMSHASTPTSPKRVAQASAETTESQQQRPKKERPSDSRLQQRKQRRSDSQIGKQANRGQEKRGQEASRSDINRSKPAPTSSPAPQPPSSNDSRASDKPSGPASSPGSSSSSPAGSSVRNPTPAKQPATPNEIAEQRPVPLAKTDAPTPTPPGPEPRSAVVESPPVAPPRPPEQSERAAGPAAEKPRRKRRRKKNNLPFILGVLTIPLLAGLAMIVAQRPGNREEKERKRPSIDTQVPEVAGSAPAQRKVPETVVAETTTKSANGYQLVADGTFLYAPPFAADSKPASLELLPTGPAVVVSARLHHLVHDPVSKELIRGLSPELADLINIAADRSKIDVLEIERCTVALHPGKQPGWPEASLVIELVTPKTAKELADIWQASQARAPDGSTIYAGDDPDGDVYYFGDSQQGKLAPDSMVKRFAVGSAERIRSVAENEGGAIPLPRSLQKLWDRSSIESDFIALVTPNFLFADGREMLLTSTPELTDRLKSVLIPDFGGVLVSAKTAENSIYSEVRAVPSGGASVGDLMGKLRAAVSSWPIWAENFVVDSTPDRSWKLLATRLPQMMRFYLQHTRFGADRDTAVANTYLPGNAATQISVATLLAMNTKPGMQAAVAQTTQKPLTVEEMLNRPMSVSFDQESLEFAINQIVDEFKQSLPDGSTMPPVRIIGSDLQKNGITQNQQIRNFAKSNVPLRKVLTDLVLGANPDKTSTGPDDPKQSLVWVVVKNADVPGGTEILVTTRDASKDTYELPPEFLIK